MKAIKVCHLASHHKMSDMRIFEKECKSLAKAGFDVTLIGFREETKTETIGGVHCISLYCPIKNNLELLRKRNKLSLGAALQVDADIYHLHEPELLPVGMKLKRKGKIVIFDSHEYYGWQLRDNIHKIKIIKTPAFLMKWIGKLYMHYENIYIGQSQNICQRVHNHLNGKGKGDVYADIKYGMEAYVRLIPCKEKKMNEKEKELIEAFHATESYNKTKGGAKGR